MIYLGNGLYSDSGHSLMHYGVRGMRWTPSKRKTNVDWSDPEEVAAYYNRTAGQATRNVTNRVRALDSRAGTAVARPISSASAVGRHAMDIYKVSGRQNRYNRRPSPDAAQAVQDGSHAPRGGFVTPRSPRDAKNRADTAKQPNGGFVTPRPNNTSGRAKADTEKSPRGGFVSPRSSAERRAADDRARSPRGGFTAPRPGYVTRDQDDKKRSPKGGPHFATKEHYQEQVNARMRKKSADDYMKSFNDQVDRKGHGTLNDWYETDHKIYVGEHGNHKIGNKKDRHVDVNKAIEAGRRRHRGDAGIRGYQTTSSQSDQGVNYDAGLKAARERARKNSQNKSDTKHNQDKRGTGTRPNITNHPQTADTRTSQKNRGYQTTLTQQSSGVKYDAGLEAARKRALDKKKKKTKGEQRSKAKDWYFNNWVKKHLPGG